MEHSWTTQDSAGHRKLGIEFFFSCSLSVAIEPLGHLMSFRFLQGISFPDQESQQCGINISWNMPTDEFLNRLFSSGYDSTGLTPKGCDITINQTRLLIATDHNQRHITFVLSPHLHTGDGAFSVEIPFAEFLERSGMRDALRAAGERRVLKSDYHRLFEFMDLVFAEATGLEPSSTPAETA